MENYISEAFQKLRLIEDDFDLSADRDVVDELKSFVADDIEEIPDEPIIDVTAEDEEDLSDNYIGKVILECTCCHSRIYKDEADVVIDEDSELANIDEECPVCGTAMGYTVIGKIEKFDDDVNFEDADEEEEEEVELENDPAEEEPVESLRDRIAKKRLQESPEKYNFNKKDKLEIADKKILTWGEASRGTDYQYDTDKLLLKVCKDVCKELGWDLRNWDFYTSGGILQVMPLPDKTPSQKRNIRQAFENTCRELYGDDFVVKSNTVTHYGPYDQDGRTFEYTKIGVTPVQVSMSLLNQYPLSSKNESMKRHIKKSLTEDIEKDRGVHMHFGWSKTKPASFGNYGAADENGNVTRSYGVSGADAYVAALFVNNINNIADDLPEVDSIWGATDGDRAIFYTNNDVVPTKDLAQKIVDRFAQEGVELKVTSIVRSNPRDNGVWAKIIKLPEEAFTDGIFHGYEVEYRRGRKPVSNVQLEPDVDESLTEGIENISVDTEDTHLEMSTKKDGGVEIETTPLTEDEFELTDDTEAEVEEPEAEEIVPLTDKEQADIIDNEEETLDDIAAAGEEEELPIPDEFEETEEEEDEKEIPEESLKSKGKVVNEDAYSRPKSIGNWKSELPKGEVKKAFDIFYNLPEEEFDELYDKIWDNFDNKGVSKQEINRLLNKYKLPKWFPTALVNSWDEQDEFRNESVEDEKDIDDFDECAFNDLVESYLRRVYENVNTFKTTAIKDSGDTIVVEGIIKFKNNKAMKSSFVFTEATETKTGKVVLEGYNTTFSKAPKSFRVRGSLKNNNYVSESLSYNYTARNLTEGKINRTKVCGRVKR